MRFIGNILWALTVGLLLFSCWAIAGLLWCVSIVGIPVGLQCFKFAKLMFAPFGREIIYGGGAGSLLLNILWIVFGGVEIAATSAAIGLVFCVTVVGIPVGLQCFKLAKLALLPFGARVR